MATSPAHPSAGPLPPNTTLTQLEAQVRAAFAGSPGHFALAFHSLSAPRQSLYINAKAPFHAASTMKTPVMVEVYRQCEARQLALSDSVLVNNTFASIVDGSPFSLAQEDDSEHDLYQSLGQKRTLESLVYQMIIRSSNLATNLVIERVGAQRVTETMRRLGARDLRVLRGVEDGKAFRAGLNNVVTAYDLALLYQKLAEGKVVTPRASQAMVQTLLDQTDRSVIPARLPPDVKVAHKTGNITGVYHDSGIIYLPNGQQYVLVLLSKDLPDVPQGVQTLAHVSELVYQFVAHQ